MSQGTHGLSSTIAPLQIAIDALQVVIDDEYGTSVNAARRAKEAQDRLNAAIKVSVDQQLAIEKLSEVLIHVYSTSRGVHKPLIAEVLEKHGIPKVFKEKQ